MGTYSSNKPDVATACGSGGVVVTNFRDKIKIASMGFHENNILWVCSAESEKKIIMVKVLENIYPVMKYFKLAEPENTKAQGILNALDHAFESFLMPDYKKNGVIKLLKEHGDVDHVLKVWCFAHRLELAIKDDFKSTYMTTVIDTLTSIYYFYEASAKRNREVEDIADIIASFGN